MKSLTIKLFLVLTFVTGSVLAADSSISGTWKVSSTVAGNELTQVCTIKQDDKKLTGSCKGETTAATDLTGEIKDKNVTWQFNTDYNGTQLTIVYKGTLDDTASNITGTVTVEPINFDGDFTAKKDGAKAGQ